MEPSDLEAPSEADVFVSYELDENTRRQAFTFGVCLADVERAIKAGAMRRL